MLVLIVLVACTTPPVSLSGKSGEVVLVLRGLVALQTDGDGLHAYFLNPSSDPHPPTLSLDQFKLTGDPGVPPDLTIPDETGRAIASWAIQEVTLQDANVSDTSLVETPGAVTGAATTSDTEIRWIPHMEDIYGTAQTLKDPGGLIGARGLFKFGDVKPRFDASKNKSEKFTIGSRVCTAVADAVQIKLQMKDSLQPLLTFKTAKGDGRILVDPGTTIALAALPLNKPTGDLTHFHHYYALVENGEEKTPEKCEEAAPTTPPTGYPVRCTPIKFP
jgi:hypothetical protein